MKLLDTSVAVDHLRGYAAATSLLQDLLRSGDTLVSSELTRFELLAGASPNEHAHLEDLFSVLDWAPVTEDISRQAAAYARAYRRSHSGIGVVDYLIASTACVIGADLLTINLRHFPMFEDLRAPYQYQ